MSEERLTYIIADLQSQVRSLEAELEKAQTFKGFNWAKASINAVCSHNKRVDEHIKDLTAQLEEAKKERDIYAELSAGKCTIAKVNEILGQQTLCSSKEYKELKSQNARLRSLLERISGMCGHPDAAQACRNILNELSNQGDAISKSRQGEV